MKINNVGIFVKDLEGAKNFFMDFFGATVHCEYNEPENNYYSYIMKFGDSSDVAKLELMCKPEIVDIIKHKDNAGYAHICITVDSKEAFDHALEKINAAGYELFYGPHTGSAKELRGKMFEDLVIEVLYK